MEKTFLNESDLDRVFRSYSVVDSHLIWHGLLQIKIRGKSVTAYRAVWAALKDCPLEEVPFLVAGCGIAGCVEPNHRVEGPKNALSAGWIYNFDEGKWYCKRNHPVEFLTCVKCERLKKRERYVQSAGKASYSRY